MNNSKDIRINYLKTVLNMEIYRYLLQYTYINNKLKNLYKSI